MKIAVTIERFEPEKGGAERSTHQIVRELAGRGHELTMLVGSLADGGALQGIETQVAGPGRLNSASAVRRYHRFVVEGLERGGFDTSLSVTTLAPAAVLQPRAGVYCELYRAAWRWQPGPWARAGRRLAPLVLPKPRAMLKAEAMTMASSRVKHVVAISRFMRDQLLIHSNIPPEQITVVPNAADPPLTKAHGRAALRRRFRQEHELDESVVAFLFPAHAPRRKGAASLLEAFATLHRLQPDAVLLMVCPREAGLEELAVRKGLPDSAIRWIGPLREMRPAYAGADVTVLPSYYDPASKVVAESLLAGVPAITTRTNGACDLIEPGGLSGLDHAPSGDEDAWRGRVISDADNVSALTQAMSEFSDEGERRRCIAATTAVAEVCSMRRHVDALERILIDAAR